MGVPAEPELSTEAREGMPSWSGIPVIAGDCMVLPLHVADTRQIVFGPGWTHIDQWPNEGGDVEYHVFRRVTARG